MQEAGKEMKLFLNQEPVAFTQQIFSIMNLFRHKK